ncbi:MAG TPA: ABC transporter permease [Verrucomicrobiae bacterium]|nr:ABC transporter permease [Verrucomicrobiae bacterium]
MSVTGLGHDARLAWRALRNRPGFGAVAVLSLAIAIGANATIFGLVDAVLVRPLPGSRPAPLVSVFTSESDGNGFGVNSYPAFKDLARQRAVFSRLGASAVLPLRFTRGETSDRVLGLMVSGSWFGTLGAQAAMGRTITPADDRTPGESPVVVISDGLWRRRFGADPSLVGRTVEMNGHAWTVVGVMPAAFRGLLMGFTPDAYVPVAMEAWAAPGRSESPNRGGRSFMVVGQLAPGMTLAQARPRLDALAAELGREYPASDSGRAFAIMPEPESRPVPQLHGVATAFLALLQGITALVLVIACANLAGLLLARGVERRREIGVRLALGGTRGRLVRMLVTESLLIGVLGGALGLALAYYGSRALTAFQPPLPLPITIDLSPDSRVAAFALSLGILASLLFSLYPALQTASPSLVGSLREDAAARRSRVRSFLLVTQVALCLLLLAGAGLFVRALARAQSMSPGFEPRGVTTIAFDPSLAGYDQSHSRAFYRRVLEEVRVLPGVEAAATAHMVPLSLDWSESGIWLPGAANVDATHALDMPANAVSEGYFATLRIPIVRGRELRVGAPAGEAMVNESFAKRYWPGREAIGQRVGLEGPEGPWLTVVGVAKDSRYRSIGEAPQPFLYVPSDQTGDDEATLLVRSSGGANVLPAIRALLRREAPQLATSDAQPLEQGIGASLLPGRLAGSVLAATGAVALLLACIGLYAVVAFSVNRRTKEIGVRVALGAQRRDILALVMGEGTRLLAWGLGLGFALSLAAGFALRSALYGLSPLDLPAYAGVLILLSLTSLIACWLPARRAAAVDPIVALRQD